MSFHPSLSSSQVSSRSHHLRTLYLSYTRRESCAQCTRYSTDTPPTGIGRRGLLRPPHVVSGLQMLQGRVAVVRRKETVLPPAQRVVAGRRGWPFKHPRIQPTEFCLPTAISDTARVQLRMTLSLTLSESVWVKASLPGLWDTCALPREVVKCLNKRSRTFHAGARGSTSLHAGPCWSAETTMRFGESNCYNGSTLCATEAIRSSALTSPSTQRRELGA